ncbi:hypothetical protein [Streptomyces sp. NPDC047028]
MTALQSSAVRGEFRDVKSPSAIVTEGVDHRLGDLVRVNEPQVIPVIISK